MGFRGWGLGFSVYVLGFRGEVFVGFTVRAPKLLRLAFSRLEQTTESSYWKRAKRVRLWGFEVLELRFRGWLRSEFTRHSN